VVAEARDLRGATKRARGRRGNSGDGLFWLPCDEARVPLGKRDLLRCGYR
jgi:hypothetical protein